MLCMLIVQRQSYSNHSRHLNKCQLPFTSTCQLSHASHRYSSGTHHLFLGTLQLSTAAHARCAAFVSGQGYTTQHYTCVDGPTIGGCQLQFTKFQTLLDLQLLLLPQSTPKSTHGHSSKVFSTHLNIYVWLQDTMMIFVSLKKFHACNSGYACSKFM